MFKTRFAFLLVGLFFSGAAQAANTNANTTLSTYVENDCILNVNTATLPVYYFSKGAITGQFTVSVKCNAGETYNISVLDGQTVLSTSSTAPVTLTTAGSAAPLNANLDLGRLVGAKTASGSDQFYTVGVSIPGNQTVATGSYSKTLTVNVSYDDVGS